MKKYCLVIVLFVAGMERMVFSSLDLSPLFPYSNFHNQEESGRETVIIITMVMQFNNFIKN